MKETILGPTQSLISLVDQSTQQKQELANEARTTSGIKYHPLRPSAAGHCSRKLALELEEFRGIKFHNKPLLESNILRLFSLGHRVEAAVISDLLSVGGLEIKYRQQVVDIFTLDTGDNVEGSIDLVIYGKDFKMIADAKSKKDKFSAFYKTNWDELKEKFCGFKSLKQIDGFGFYAQNLQDLIDELNGDFIIDNLLQLNLYANTSFIKDRGIDIATLIYYNKNDSRMLELRFKPCLDVFNLIKEKFNYVSNSVKEGTVEEMACDFQIGTLRHSTCDCHKYSPYLPEDPSQYYFNNLPAKQWPKDVDKFKESSKIAQAYSKFLSAVEAEKEKEKAEQFIIQQMLSTKTQKIRFEDTHIYEAKYYKTTGKYSLKRSKL